MYFSFANIEHADMMCFTVEANCLHNHYLYYYYYYYIIHCYMPVGMVCQWAIWNLEQ